MKYVLRTAALTLLLLLQSHVPLVAQSYLASTAAVHSHTSAATLTIPAPAAGQFAYVTGINITNCAGASAVTAAAPTYITTTNLSGAPQFQLGSGVTAGVCQPTINISLTAPLRATAAATAVTFVLPTFATNQTVSMNVFYHYGPSY